MHEEGRSEENTLHKSVDVIKRNPVERVRNLYIAHIVGLFIWPILLIALILSYVWKKDQQYGWHYKHQIRMVWTVVGGLVGGTLFTGMITKGNDAQLGLWIPLMLFVAIYVVIGYVKGMRKLDGLTPEPQDKATGRSVADNYEQSDMRAFPMNVGIRGRMPIPIVHDKNNIEKEQSLEGVPSSPKNTHQISNERHGTTNALVVKKELDDAIAPHWSPSIIPLVASIGAVVAVIWLVSVAVKEMRHTELVGEIQRNIISQMDVTKEEEQTQRLLIDSKKTRDIIDNTKRAEAWIGKLNEASNRLDKEDVSPQDIADLISLALEAAAYIVEMNADGGYLHIANPRISYGDIQSGRITQMQVDNLFYTLFLLTYDFALLQQNAVLTALSEDWLINREMRVGAAEITTNTTVLRSELLVLLLEQTVKLGCKKCLHDSELNRIREHQKNNTETEILKLLLYGMRSSAGGEALA
jgi:uncharacterized membrane protein